MQVNQRSKGEPLLHQMISLKLDYKSIISVNGNKNEIILE